MDQLRGTIYRFDLDELPRLGAVMRLMERIVHVPTDFSQREFEAGLERPESDDQRRALELPPDQDRLLLREFLESRQKAKKAANRVGPASSFYRVVNGTMLFSARAPELSPIKESVNDVFGHECPVQGYFYYPPKGFRGWHTNAYDRPGWRMYVVFASKPALSCFRVFDDERSRIVDFTEQIENIYFFRIHPKCLLWHGVLSAGAHRWSIGFAVPPYWASTLALETPAGRAYRDTHDQD